MRKFTKFFFALLVLCCMAGVQSVNAATEKVYATFENPTPADNATWVGTTKTFTWSGSWSNAISNIGLPTGDITAYEKIVVDCDIISGEHYRILFYATGHGTTSIAIPVTQDGKVEFKIADYITNDDYLTQCSGICLSGGTTSSGEVKVNEVYLETYDEEVVIDNTKKHATFAAPQNRNTTWDSETRTFGWTDTGYNQLMNIGLPTGDISKYKKLVIDCTITSGESFRILFYDSQLSGNETVWITQSGITTINIKNTISESFILNCGQICLSGSNQVKTGSVIIHDLYLETYPEGESFDDIMLTPGMFHNWDGIGADAQSKGAPKGVVANYEREVGNGTTIFGFDNGTVPSTSYADLTGCSKMVVKGTKGVGVRTLWNRQTDNGSDFIEVVKVIGEDGIVTFDFKNDTEFKDCEYLHLNVIKNNGAAGIIDYIKFDGNFELVVTDGKNFTPTFKEYNTASYERSFNTDYAYGTICLPFAPDAATCDNYTFYKLASGDTEALIFEEETTPEANTPYLYCPVNKESTTHTFTGGETTVSSNAKTVIGGDWNMIGALAKTTITNFDELGYHFAYSPASANPDDERTKDNELVMATNSMTVNPYRAYFVYAPQISFDDPMPYTTVRVVVRGQDNGDGTTNIEEIITPDQIEGATPAIYDLMGRPVQQMQKGQIYIVNGKKVVY